MLMRGPMGPRMSRHLYPSVRINAPSFADEVMPESQELTDLSPVLPQSVCAAFTA